MGSLGGWKTRQEHMNKRIRTHLTHLHFGTHNLQNLQDMHSLNVEISMKLQLQISNFDKFRDFENPVTGVPFGWRTSQSLCAIWTVPIPRTFHLASSTSCCLARKSWKIQYDPIRMLFGDVFKDSEGCSTYVRPSKQKTAAFPQLVDFRCLCQGLKDTWKMGKLGWDVEISVHQSEIDSNSAKANNWMCAPGYAGTVTFYCAFGPNCTLINEPAGSSVILALFGNFVNFFMFIFHPSNQSKFRAFLTFFLAF